MRDTRELDRRIQTITTCLNDIRSIFGWGMSSAVVFYWAGLSDDPTIQALGIKVPREHGFWFACLFYLLINVRIADKLMLIGRQFRALDADDRKAAALVVEDHPWFANPFCWSAPWRCAKGTAVLILAWWFCNSSLFTLLDYGIVYQYALRGLFLVVGIVALLSIDSSWSLVQRDLSPDSLDRKTRISFREGAALLAIACGLILHLYTLHLLQVFNDNGDSKAALSDEFQEARSPENTEFSPGTSFRLDLTDRKHVSFSCPPRDRVDIMLLALTNIFILSEVAGASPSTGSLEIQAISDRQEVPILKEMILPSLHAAMSSLLTFQSLRGNSAWLRLSNGRISLRSFQSLPRLHVPVSASASFTVFSLAGNDDYGSYGKPIAFKRDKAVKESIENFSDSLKCIFVLRMTANEQVELQGQLRKVTSAVYRDAWKREQVSCLSDDWYWNEYEKKMFGVSRNLGLLNESDIDAYNEFRERFKPKGNPSEQITEENIVDDAKGVLSTLRRDLEGWMGSEEFQNLESRLKDRFEHALSNFEVYDVLMDTLENHLAPEMADGK